MKHPLFVGHFELTVRTPSPKVTHAVDLKRVRDILIKYCDKDTKGVPIINLTIRESVTSTATWLSQINKEDVFVKDGYLICPWLGLGINKTSISFIDELCTMLGVQVYEPGDATYYTLEQLAEIEKEFCR